MSFLLQVELYKSLPWPFSLSFDKAACSPSIHPRDYQYSANTRWLVWSRRSASKRIRQVEVCGLIGSSLSSAAGQSPTCERWTRPRGPRGAGLAAGSLTGAREESPPSKYQSAPPEREERWMRREQASRSWALSPPDRLHGISRQLICFI